MRSVRTYAICVGITSGIVVYIYILLLQQLALPRVALDLSGVLGGGLILGVFSYGLCKFVLRHLAHEFRGEVASSVGATPPPVQADELRDLRQVYDFAVATLTRTDRYAAIADQLRSSDDISRTFTVIAEQAARTLPADGAALLLLDGQRLRSVLAWNLDGEALLQSGQEALLWRALHENRPLLAHTSLDAANTVGRYVEALAAAPVIIGARPVGVFVLSNRSDPSAFQEPDLHPVRFFAGQMAIACRLAQWDVQASAARNTLAALVQVARELSDSADLADLLRRLLVSGAALTLSSHGTVLLLDADGARVSRRITLDTDNIAPLELVAGPMMRQGLAGWVARERRAALIHDTEIDQRWLPGPGLGDIRSALAVPLVVNDRAIGVVTLAHEAPDHYREEHLQLLEGLVLQAALAIRGLNRPHPSIDSESSSQPTGQQEVVALCAELHGFTGACDKLSPEVLVCEVLDVYIGTITEVLQQYTESIEWNSGDRIVALFGRPTPQADDVVRAIHAALAMRQAAGRLRAIWRANLRIELDIAIGIGRGNIAIGRVPLRGHNDHTVAGFAISYARRLQSLARGGEILVAAELLEGLGENQPDVALDPLPPLSIGDGGIQHIYRVAEAMSHVERPRSIQNEAEYQPAVFRTTQC